METRRIATQLHGSLHGEAWHGPALVELLAGVTAEQAAARPLAAAHTIWEIVLHVAAWQVVARRRMEGTAVRLTDAEDWPPVGETGAEAWKEAQAALTRSTADLERAIQSLPDERLEERAAGKEYTIYFLVHGVIQHNLYHAGQIALLRKLG